MKKCPGCGESVSPSDVECSFCGTPLQPGGAVSTRPVVAGRKTYIDSLGSDSLYVPRAHREESRGIVKGDSGAPPAGRSAPSQTGDDDPFVDSVSAPASPRKATQFGAASADSKKTIVGEGAPGTFERDPWSEAAGEASSEQSLPSAQSAGGLVGAVLNFSLDSRGTLHPVRLGRTFVGRKGDSELHIEVDDGKVSSPHCVLVARPSGVFLQDHMSTNGTFFRRGEDGEFVDLQLEMNNSAGLVHGDFFRVGDSILQYVALDSDQMRRIWG